MTFLAHGPSGLDAVKELLVVFLAMLALWALYRIFAPRRP